MLRHTLTSALEHLRARVAVGWPSLHAAARTLRLTEKARAELDTLLDAVRFDAIRCMVPASIGALGLTCWEDVGGLARPEVVGLLTIALQRVAHTPEVGAGPLFPGLHQTGDL